MKVILPLMVFFEKIVAFLKQIIVAKYFGTTVYTDAYQMAENIVSIIRGAFSNSIPVAFLTRTVHKKNNNEKLDFFSTNVISSCSLLILAITFIMCFVVRFGMQADHYCRSLSEFILILSPTILLGYLSCSLGARLEAEKTYWPSKISSLLTSVCVISAVVLLFSKLDIVSIFIGEIVALILHIILMAYIWKKSIHFLGLLLNLTKR